MRISDWSADVCSSDLLVLRRRNPRLQRAVVGQDQQALAVAVEPAGGVHAGDVDIVGKRRARLRRPAIGELRQDAVRLVEDRQSVVEGKSVSVRVDLGGRRSIKKKNRKREK